MDRPKCGVKNCEGKAMIAYGGKFICGNCMMKIVEIDKKRQEKMLEELEK